MHVRIKPRIWQIFTLYFLLVFNIIVIASAGSISNQSVQNQVIIFSGQIPAGDGNVSIRTSSGNFYQVQTMTPAGVIQALAGTGMINGYEIGDELLEKRGFLTLDGINSYQVSKNDIWFVSVNGVVLREYQFPETESINRFQLNNGDEIIFAYGDSSEPVNHAKAIIWVGLGDKDKHNSLYSQQYLYSTNNLGYNPTDAVSVQQGSGLPDIVSRSESIVTTTPIITSISTTSNSNQTVNPVSTNTTANQPLKVTELVLPTINVSINTSVNSTINESMNQLNPVPVLQTPIPTATSIITPSLTLVVTSAPTPNITPLLTPNITPTYTPTPVITSEITPTDTLTPVPTISGDNRTIFNGSLIIPEGTVNVTSNNGLEYSVNTTTPIGILQRLLTDKIIKNYSINDRGMNKGGILILEGINEFFYSGKKGWFVKLNGKILDDFANPDTYGLNILSAKTGDQVSFYYGEPSRPVSEAESIISVTLE